MAILALALALGLVPGAAAGSKLEFFPDQDGAGIPSWAGSDAIVFQDGNRGVFRATPSTGAVVPLVLSTSSTSASLGFHDVSPDGRAVALADLGSPEALLDVPIGREPPTTIVSYPDDGILDQITWRPDGQRIAYTREDSEVDTVAVPSGTPNVVIPEDEHVFASLLSYEDDGSLVVLRGETDEQHLTLYRYQEGGGAPTTLATDVDSAAVSPDGSTAVYFTHDGSLHSVSTSGGTPIDLGLDGMEPWGDFAFSPDSSRVAITTQTPYPDYTPYAWIGKLDGSQSVTLANADVGYFTWSPDGMRLAARGLGTRANSVMLLDPDGSGQVVAATSPCFPPKLSPDGYRLACDYPDGLTSGNYHLAALAFQPPPGIPRPTIKGFTPAQAAPGSMITITGSGYTGATAIQIGGLPTTFSVSAGGKKVVATVPAGADSDSISIVGPGGTTSSRSVLEVTHQIPLADCLASGNADSPTGQLPVLAASWHMASSSYLRPFLSSTRTTLTVNGSAEKKAAWNRPGESDGAGGWVTTLSFPLATIPRTQGATISITFQVVVTKTFSDGTTTYTPGEQLFAGSGCTIQAS